MFDLVEYMEAYYLRVADELEEARYKKLLEEAENG